MSATTTKTGRCLCGKIKYELTGATATPLYDTVCHCTNCRRMTGSAFMSASICPVGGLNITEGAEFQKTYIDTAVDSGTHLKRIFCSECGTALRQEVKRPNTEQWTDFKTPFLGEVEGVKKDSIFGRAVTAKSTE